MKIACYVRPFYPMRGGIESISQLVSAQLDADGHEVVVITEALLCGQPELEGRRIVVREPGFFRMWREFRNSEVILFFGLSLRALPAALLSLRPLVVSHHGIYPADPTLVSRLFRFMRLLPSRFILNICVSHYVAKSIPGRTVVVHNAYDDRKFVSHAEPERKFEFCFCGRLVSEKGADILLDAFEALLRADRKLRLLVVGDGPERHSLEQRARETGSGESVVFVGSKDSEGVARLMVQSSVVVVPSLCEESFGIVVLEALASGCGVVVTRKGGLPEAAGKFGTIVDANSEALAAGMRHALQTSGQLLRDRPAIKKYLASRRGEVVGRRYEKLLSLAAGKVIAAGRAAP